MISLSLLPSPTNQAGPEHLTERAVSGQLWATRTPGWSFWEVEEGEHRPLRGGVLGKEGKEKEVVVMF